MMRSVWEWISENYQQLNIIVTLLVLIVTALTVFLTRSLAKAALLQAHAAAQQAGTTQQIFESSHRPVLGLSINVTSFFVNDDHYRFRFLLENHGQVPAILRASKVVVRLDGGVVLDRALPSEGRCIFPGANDDLEVARVSSGQLGGGPVEVELLVSYVGFDAVERTSRIRMTGSFNNWTRMLTEIR
jgi:hypothetical protein